MIKADLINKIAREMNLSRQEAELGVNLFFETIKEAILRGEEIELRGFGSFRFRERGPRVGRNPRTGESVKVPSKKVLYFKPSKLLKNLIKGFVDSVPPDAVLVGRGTGTKRFDEQGFINVLRLYRGNTDRQSAGLLRRDGTVPKGP